MKKKLNKRILSALLALVLLLTNFPVIGFADGSFSIMLDGNVVKQVEFHENEKITVTAENNPGSGYQWQIRIPGTEQWVNIYGQTGQTISLSKAVVGSLMSGGSAYVRCAAISDGEEIDHTAALRTMVKKEEPAPEVSAAPAAQPMPTELPTEVTEAPTEPAPEATEAPAEATEAPTEPVTETEPVETPTEPIEIPAETAAPTEPEAEAVATAPGEEAVVEATEAPAETAAPAEPEAEAVAIAPVEEAVVEATEAPAETAAPTEPEAEAVTTVPVEEAVVEATEAPAETAAPTEPEAEAVAAPVEEAAIEATETPAESAEENTAEAFAEKVVRLLAPRANGDALAEEMVTVTVRYIRKEMVNGQETEVQVFAPYTAELQKGSAFSADVPVPGYMGYSPEHEWLSDDKTVIRLNYAAVDQSVTVTVLYGPAMVNFSVRYYAQNIYNDQYTEYEYKTGLQGLTGTYPKELVESISIPGFTKLYNYPEVVAADGSTEFQVYYDRNYYLYNFVLDGGYGVDPVYVRYGTTLVVPDPVRPGYIFAGWDLWEDQLVDGETVKVGDGVADPLDATIGLGNKTYQALWTVADTTFNVIYWVQNADDDGYSYAHSVEGVAANTGDVINFSNFHIYHDPDGEQLTGSLPENHALYKYSELDKDATARAYDKDENGQMIDYGPGEIEDYGVQIKGDGSSVVNIYFKRKEYTLRFVYARQHADGTVHIATNTIESSYNGYTYKGSSESTPYGRDITLDQIWNEKVKSLPEIIGDDVTKGSFTDGEWTYYYFSLTARYRANIADKWPATADAAGTGDLGTVTNDQNVTFQCVGWCAHYQSNFADNNFLPSAVVTGTYATLDDQILMDPAKTDEETHTLLAHWSKNEYLWEYRFYVGITEEEFYDECNGDYTNTIENPFINAASHPYWYRFKLVDSQITYSFSEDKSYQPRATLPGIRYTARGDKEEDVNGDGVMDKVVIYYYYRYEHSLIFNNYDSVLLSYKTPFDKPTTSGGWDWAFQEVDGVRGEYQRAEGVWNLYESAYAVDYGISLDWHIGQADAAIANNYPSTLEPDAYEFAGWYTGPNGTGYQVVFDAAQPENHMETDAQTGEKRWYNPTMPDDDLILFAYWAPRSYDLKVYATLSDIAGDDPVMTLPDIRHGDILSTSTVQQLRNAAENKKPSPNATFVGWFYLDDNGSISAFDPANMGISGEIQLFAQWKTDADSTYEIHYYKEDGTPFKDDSGNPVIDTGYAYIASTRTFSARVFEGYFPTYGSTSIVISADGAENVVAFHYVQKEEVEYTVKCWDVTNGVWLEFTVDGKTGMEYTGKTSSSVMDIAAPHIDQYLATVATQRVHLTANGDDNTVIFYYTENVEEQAWYVVRHLLQDVNDPAKYEEIHSLESLQATIGSPVTASATEPPIGFALNPQNTQVSGVDGGEYHIEGNSVTVDELPASGLEIRFCYDRETYQYTVQYVEYGKASNVLGTQNGSEKYGATVTPTLPETLEKDDITYHLRDGEQGRAFTVRADDTQVYTYFYEAQYTTVNYIAVTQGGPSGGLCSPNMEQAAGNFSGSTATPNDGFYFVGWYTDSACTQPVTDADGETSEDGKKFTPKHGEDRTFYALFKPYKLTISQDGEIKDNDSAIYEVLRDGAVVARVMITGPNSATVQQVKPGVYTVQRIEKSWAWTYKMPSSVPANGRVEVAANQDNVITFTYGPPQSCWLTGENRR